MVLNVCFTPVRLWLVINCSPFNSRFAYWLKPLVCQICTSQYNLCQLEAQSHFTSGNFNFGEIHCFMCLWFQCCRYSRNYLCPDCWCPLTTIGVYCTLRKVMDVDGHYFMATEYLDKYEIFFNWNSSLDTRVFILAMWHWFVSMWLVFITDSCRWF